MPRLALHRGVYNERTNVSSKCSRELDRQLRVGSFKADTFESHTTTCNTMLLAADALEIQRDEIKSLRKAAKEFELLVALISATGYKEFEDRAMLAYNLTIGKVIYASYPE